MLVITDFTRHSVRQRMLVKAKRVCRFCKAPPMTRRSCRCTAVLSGFRLFSLRLPPPDFRLSSCMLHEAPARTGATNDGGRAGQCVVRGSCAAHAATARPEHHPADICCAHQVAGAQACGDTSGRRAARRVHRQPVLAQPVPSAVAEPEGTHPCGCMFTLPLLCKVGVRLIPTPS